MGGPQCTGAEGFGPFIPEILPPRAPPWKPPMTDKENLTDELVGKWAENRLAQAYALIEAVFTDKNQPSESGISETLKRALSAVEEADCELGRYQR